MGDPGEELIRDVWARWNAGQRELDPEITDPELVIHSALTGEIYEGAAGLRRWVEEIDDQFEAWQLGVDEVRGLGGGRYVAHGSIRARGRGSGMRIDGEASWLIEVRDGRIAMIRNFIGPQARAAAEEEAG